VETIPSPKPLTGETKAPNHPRALGVVQLAGRVACLTSYEPRSLVVAVQRVFGKQVRSQCPCEQHQFSLCGATEALIPLRQNKHIEVYFR
jgi:hypothetical protein